jgi:DNA-binding GntR family transcriptional regulator
MDTNALQLKPNAAAAGAGTRADRIAFSVLRAIADQRLAPGTRLSEGDLAKVFDVSRTIVRQALTRLAAQGLVGVRAKKGWFIIEPGNDEIRDTFAARRLVEGALLRAFVPVATAPQLRALEQHLRRQRDAIAGDDTALRTHLLTDFHVQIAEMMGNAVVTRLVRDLTMRTNLISMLYQSGQDASHSADEHRQVLNALRSRDAEQAVRLMSQHLESVERGLRDRRTVDPVRQLRELLDADGDERDHAAAGAKRGAASSSSRSAARPAESLPPARRET